MELVDGIIVVDCKFGSADTVFFEVETVFGTVDTNDNDCPAYKCMWKINQDM